MGNCNCYNVSHLPDIDMYGGDTTPWQVNVVNKDGTPFIIEDEDKSKYSAELVFCPLKSSYGMSQNSSSDNVMLRKAGVLQTSATQTAVMFYFLTDDTEDLRGKFIYQVKITYDDSEDTTGGTSGSSGGTTNDATDVVVKISQGIVYIKQNIDTGSV